MAKMITPAMKRLNISGNAHGIKSGWFYWPINFDPVWLESCNGFEAKKEEYENTTKKGSDSSEVR